LPWEYLSTGDEIFEGGRRVRTWWASVQSKFGPDDQRAGVFEYVFTIAVLVVAAIAGAVLVLIELRGR
jgi:hypothetical protein